MSMVEHAMETAGYSDLVKVVFHVPPGSILGGGTETLWAEDLGGGLYRLRNSPFYANGVSFEDVVVATEKDDELFFSGVKARGGHSTYRVFLREGTTEDQFLLAWHPLERLGCSYEGATRRLIAIDVPPQASIHEVYGLLERAEGAEIWDFQEGHCAHPLRNED